MARRKHSLWGMSAAQLQFLQTQHEREREDQERAAYERDVVELQMQHQYWLMQQQRQPKYNLLHKRSQPAFFNHSLFSLVTPGTLQSSGTAAFAHSQTQMFGGRKATHAGFLASLPMRAATVAGPGNFMLCVWYKSF